MNARIDAIQIFYRKHKDIGIVVGGGGGLVLPLPRNAESISFAAIERSGLKIQHLTTVNCRSTRLDPGTADDRGSVQ